MPTARCLWSIVLPYYNEERFIEATIRSALALEGGPHHLILVDNGSTDRSTALCRALLAGGTTLRVTFVREFEPGPVHALHAGFQHVDTPFVSLWNADTVYPPDYLRQAEGLLGEPGVVAAMAAGVTDANDTRPVVNKRYRTWLLSLVWSRQAHTGTYGQSFRTEALAAAGGPRSRAWPYVLDDHELMQRVFAFGRSRYSPDLWCVTSDRRKCAPHVRWTALERLVYLLTPYPAKDWFFHSWLARRFAERGMLSANLRARDWESDGAVRPIAPPAGAARRPPELAIAPSD